MSNLKLREVIKQIRQCKTAAEERGVVFKESALIRNAFKVRLSDPLNIQCLYNSVNNRSQTAIKEIETSPSYYSSTCSATQQPSVRSSASSSFQLPATPKSVSDISESLSWWTSRQTYSWWSRTRSRKTWMQRKLMWTHSDSQPLQSVPPKRCAESSTLKSSNWWRLQAHTFVREPHLLQSERSKTFQT